MCGRAHLVGKSFLESEVSMEAKAKARSSARWTLAFLGLNGMMDDKDTMAYTF